MRMHTHTQATGSAHPSAAPYRTSANSAFGDLVLQSQIGQGTYGAVWRGTHKGNRVAVKVLPIEGEHAAQVAAEIRFEKRAPSDDV